MKALKLILIFTAILGGIVGFFFFSGGDVDNGLEIKDPIQIKKHSKDIKRAWERNQDWNEATFLKYHELATQLDNKQLKDLNTTEAIKITEKKIFAQWSSQDCNHDTIQKYIDGINTIKNKDVNAKNNPTVKTIEDVNTIYQEAYKFVNNKGQFKIYPKLQVPDSGYIYTWTAFDTLNVVENIKVKKQKIERDERYRNHLSNINTIKNGLGEIPNKLEESKEQYYDSLATEIRIKFDQISPEERKQEQLDDLSVVVQTHFESEWKEIEDLKNLVDTFFYDVQNNNINRMFFLDDDFYYNDYND